MPLEFILQQTIPNAILRNNISSERQSMEVSEIQRQKKKTKKTLEELLPT